MWHDIFYSVRVLSKNRRFAILAILTLAVGIGAATAVFTVFDAALLRTLPVRQPDRLVLFERVAADGESDGSFAYPMFRELRDRGEAVLQPVAYWLTRASVDASVDSNVDSSAVAANRPDRLAIELVSGNYFEVLGITAARGRVLTANDDRLAGAHPVAVISHAYWLRAFGAAESALGSTLRVNGYPFTIVGISAPSYRGFTVGAPAVLQIPMAMQGQVWPDWQVLERSTSWHQIFGVLAPSVSIERARNAINGHFQQITREQLRGAGELPPGVREEVLAERVTLLPAARGLSTVRGTFTQPLSILLGVVALLLLIACANFANVLIARGLSRTKEMALRDALGVGRGRLLRQLTIESVMLAIIGGAIALVPAVALARVLLTQLPNDAASTPEELIVGLDLRVLLFSFVVSIVTGVFFGALPAALVSRADLTPVMKDAGPQTGEGRVTRHVRAGLVIVQLAFALVLLAATGVLIRTVDNLRHVEPGFRRQHMLLFSLNPSEVGYTRETSPALYSRLIEELESAPGVKAATVSRVDPLGGNSRTETIAVPGHVPRPGESMNVDIDIVAPRYFETLGIPIIAGRDISRHDSKEGGRVAIVNEAFVRRFLGTRGTRAALGQDIHFGQIQPDVPGIRIVGVARDTRYQGLRQQPSPRIVLPLAQEPADDMTVYVWTELPTAHVLPEIRRRLAVIEPRLPMFHVRTMTEQVDQSIVGERLLSTLSGTVGVMALLLAAVGMYGVLSYDVSRRGRELGVRIALGADRTALLGLLLKRNLMIVLLALATGSAAAAPLLRLLRDRVYGVSPLDPLMTMAAIAIVSAVGMGSGIGPAIRATRRDPASVLRSE